MPDALQSRPFDHLSVKDDDTRRPPEPPTKPISGPVFEMKGGNHFCRVPGCARPQQPFEKPNSIAIHLSRRHGLTMNGIPTVKSSGVRPAPIKAPEPDWKTVSVRDVLAANDVSLVYQAVRIIERAKENLSGKLHEMEQLKRKSAKLDVIAGYLKELLPGPGPGGVLQA